MRIWFLVMLACALAALAFALRWVDRMLDVVDGVMFGVSIGSVVALYAWRSRQRACAQETR